MPVLGYPIDALVARLEGIPQLRLVGLAADLESLQASPPRALPAAFVLSESKGGPRKFSSGFTQQGRTERIVLLVWVRNHAGAAAAAKDMRTLLEAIDARCVGWRPGDAFASLQFVSARDELFDNGHLVKRVIYESAWDFISPSQP